MACHDHGGNLVLWNFPPQRKARKRTLDIELAKIVLAKRTYQVGIREQTIPKTILSKQSQRDDIMCTQPVLQLPHSKSYALNQKSTSCDKRI